MEGQEQVQQPIQNTETQQVSQNQSEFRVPEGHRLVRDDEYTTLGRYKQQYDGSKPLIDAALKHGFKDANAFDEIGRLNGLVTKGGFKSLGDFAKVFEGSLAEDPEAPAQGGLDIESLRREGFIDKNTLDNEKKIWRAETQHEREIEKQGSRIDAAVKALTEGVTSSRDKYLIEQAFQNKLWSNADFYGDDHPLAGTQTVRPFSDAEIMRTIDDVKKHLALDEAGEVADLANAVSKTKPAKPPAGTSGGSGKPEKAEGRQSLRQGIYNTPIPKRGQPQS